MIDFMVSAQPPTIVSIGYEQRNIDDIVALLVLHDVQVLIDVRLNPISRKPGFSKSALTEALRIAGIEYRHERDLGNPRENRGPFRRGLNSARERYLRHLQNGASAVYRAVVEAATATRVALLCFEREHHECHRSCIIEKAQSDVPGLRVITV